MGSKSKRKTSKATVPDDKRLKIDPDIHLVKSEDDALRILNDLKHSNPVLQLHLHKSDPLPDPGCELSGSKDLLNTLIYPLSPRSFHSSCFRQKALHIKSNNRDRARNISETYMFGLDAKKIFEETSSDCIFLWIPPNSNDTHNKENSKNALLSIEVQDPNTAHILHTCSNYASYCRAPPELEQILVSHMLRGTGLGLGQYDASGEKLTTLGRGEVETFIGTKGHLTDWHTDFQENFTIQLSGRKKWTLKQGSVKHPLRGTTPHYKSSEDVIENQIKSARLSNPSFQFGQQDLESNSFGEEVEVIMDAGDILYFPAGMWHKVETLEYGVSINISLMGSTYASLICRSLEHILLKKDEWREVICSDGYCVNAVERIKNLLNDLPRIVRNFGETGGAQAILPPALRHPASFQMTSGMHNGHDEESVDEEENSVNSTESHDVSTSSDVGLKNDMLEVETIDIHTFECPNDYEPPHPSGDKWRKNPLSSLIQMSDVKLYYSSNQNTEENENDSLFILNVNFAGNDMHESSVRVVFQDDKGLLNHWCSLDDEGVDNEIRKLKNPPYALIHYGYIV